jgi:hypothetical protein
MNLAMWIVIGGVLHFGILLASGLTPQVLDWRQALKPLDPLLRQLIWVHGAFIVLMIVLFGLLSVALPGELASGTTLARAVCGGIGLFWCIRLGIQFFLFDARAYLTQPLLRFGYHGLTLVFLYNTIVYTWAALHPWA